MQKPTQKQIDSFRNLELSPQKLLIGGQWVDAEDQQTCESISPIDGRPLTTLAMAGIGDVDRCVASARTAFNKGDWSRADPGKRKKVLLDWAQLIEQHQCEIAVLGVRDNGTEISMAYRSEPGSAVSTLRYYAESVDKVYGQVAPTSDKNLAMVVREPIGVVGAIIPWNFPLMIGMWKVAAALAAGNTVILKPPQLASLSWLRIAQLACQAGMPDGVLNILTGSGAVAGHVLSMHDDVDVLTFTGGGSVGRKLLEDSAASNLKRVYLELGGKSPHLVFADSQQIDTSIKTVIKAIFRNAGQVCIAGSRLLVQEEIAEDYLNRLVEHARKLKVGDPLDLGTEVGAVCGEAQLAQDLKMVQEARQDGAQLRCGGERILEDLGGTYMSPTVFSQVAPDSRLAQDEVFGPVLAVMPFTDEAHALRLANQSCYGLSAGLWTEDISRAHRVANGIQSGLVHVNCYGGSPLSLPTGGMKQSGNGYDKSMHALDKFVNLKSIWFNLSGS